MITLDTSAFVSELENASWFIFSMGFYVGITIGIFIALLVYFSYVPERVSTSDK